MKERDYSNYYVIVFFVFLVAVGLYFSGVLIPPLREFHYSDFEVPKNYLSQISSGQLQLEWASISLGDTGSPGKISDIPEGVTRPVRQRLLKMDAPQVHAFSTTECLWMELDPSVRTVLALTTYRNPEEILITVPKYSSGAMNVCAPAGATVMLLGQP